MSEPVRKVLRGPASGAGPSGGESRMESALARHGGGAMAHAGRVPASILELKEKVRMAYDAGLLPSDIGTIEKATVIALKGAELGLPIMQAFASIYVVKGKPAPKTELLVALAHKRIPGFTQNWIRSDDQEAIVELTRPGSRFTSKYGMADAQREGLAGSDNYKKRPAVMLRWRALANGLRILAPDVMQGSYTAEELLGPSVPVEVETAVMEGDSKRAAIAAQEPPSTREILDTEFAEGGDETREEGGPSNRTPEPAPAAPPPDVPAGADERDALNRAIETVAIEATRLRLVPDAPSDWTRAMRVIQERAQISVSRIRKDLEANTLAAAAAKDLAKRIRELADALAKEPTPTRLAGED